MPTLTNVVMAAVSVEDAGIGPAVNDVALDPGSALCVAVIGSFISRLYRDAIGQTPSRTQDPSSRPRSRAVDKISSRLAAPSL